jgi:hypothetical protein
MLCRQRMAASLCRIRIGCGLEHDPVTLKAHPSDPVGQGVVRLTLHTNCVMESFGTVAHSSQHLDRVAVRQDRLPFVRDM